MPVLEIGGAEGKNDFALLLGDESVGEVSYSDMTVVIEARFRELAEKQFPDFQICTF